MQNLESIYLTTYSLGGGEKISTTLIVKIVYEADETNASNTNNTNSTNSTTEILCLETETRLSRSDLRTCSCGHEEFYFCI
jgi:hypothetical protein